MNVGFIGAVLILLGACALCAQQILHFTRLAKELKSPPAKAAEPEKTTEENAEDTPA